MSKKEINFNCGQTIAFNEVQNYVTTKSGIAKTDNPNLIISSLCCVTKTISVLDEDLLYKVIEGVNPATGKHFEIHVLNSEFVVDYKYSLVKQLSDLGVEIVYGQHKVLMEYLASQKPVEHVFAVRQIGWHQGRDNKMVFVIPDGMIGETTPPITLLSSEDSVVHKAIHSACTLKEEQTYITNYCSGNYLLIFSMGIAYASLMMKLLKIEGGGFHFYGHSSRGKTTILQIIAAIFGNGVDPGRNSNGSYIQSWDATGFAIELMAKSFNDCAFLLDELHKYSDNKLASLVYSLTGGKGRSRGQTNLTLRSTNEWTNMIASTGEHSIQAAIAKIDPKKVTTGQQVRINSVLVEDNVFPETHGMEAREFVEMLKDNCSKYYGASGKLFIEHLVSIANNDELLLELKLRHKQLAIDLEQPDMLIEQTRVLPRFAAVQLGLQMASEQRLISISADELDNAVTQVLSDWLEGVSTLSDIDQGIINIRTYIRTNPGRFKDIDDPNDNSTNIVGFYKSYRNLYLIIPEKFEEVCGKSHTREILKEMMARDLLLMNNTDGNGNHKPSSRHRVAGELRSTSFYAVKAKILDDEPGAVEVEISGGNPSLEELLSRMNG